MISFTAMAAIALIALGLVLTPGPNMIYLVSRSVAQGRRAGLISLAGVTAGFLVYVAAATAGITTVFTLVPPLYTAIKAAGAVYLLWLAWRTVRPGGTAAFAAADPPADRPRRLFTMGLVTNLLNPKIAILYVSLLPQFTDPDRGHVAVQSMLLGVTQIAVAVAVNALIVLGAGGIAVFLARRPGWQRAQRYLMGSVLAGLAVHMGLGRPATA
ncbi:MULTISPECIES: LysE family translocator [unclassified Spirillospora]|uniref:LysE family translocator n=1 Tax=unclassified Spirillospora TaxID=2642701 RepID=UPI00371004B7